jgi:hypothetical protein
LLYLARSELADGSHYVIARAIGLHRVNRVVVGCPRLKALDTHAENGTGMARVQPDWRFRRLAQVRRIRTIAHDAVMLGRAPRVVACPPDNDQLVLSQFELWSLRDPDARGFFSSRALLRGSRG